MKSREELKEEFKNMKVPAGVYQLRNLSNDKIFVGGSVNLPAMWNRLQMQLNSGGHTNSSLQQDWSRVGAAGFVFEILWELRQEEGNTTPLLEQVTGLETLFIEELQPYDSRGYNQRKITRKLG